MSTCNDTFGIQHTGRIRYNITVAQQSITIITSVKWLGIRDLFLNMAVLRSSTKIGWLKRSYLDFWAKLFLYVCNRQLAGISFGWIELVYIEWHSQWLTFKMLGGYIFSFEKMQEIWSSVLSSSFYVYNDPFAEYVENTWLVHHVCFAKFHGLL